MTDRERALAALEQIEIDLSTFINKPASIDWGIATIRAALADRPGSPPREHRTEDDNTIAELRAGRDVFYPRKPPREDSPKGAHPEEYGHWDVEDIRRLLYERDALRALTEDSPKGEPATWMIVHPGCVVGPTESLYEVAMRKAIDAGPGTEVVPLYRGPPEGQQAAGWKLVPIEATHEMKWAANDYMTATADRPKGMWWFNRLYQAMLAAAPTPIAGDEGKEP